MVRISEIQQFPEFPETFREISVPFAAISKFWKVLMENAQNLNHNTLQSSDSPFILSWENSRRLSSHQEKRKDIATGKEV